MMETLLTILQLPLYAAGCYVAGLLVMLPGAVLGKALDGPSPKWHAHVGIAVLGFFALALYFGAARGLLFNV